ncbi:MAG: hypothetical protein NOU37_09265 [Candidatus Brocadiales bacterium]|nr:hypothetical protein [Candidatus Bathyanammoxibius amoris]
MAIPEPLTALVSFLEADADVATLAGTRIYGYELPQSEAASGQMPRKAVVLNPAGGGGVGPGVSDYVEVQHLRVDVFCYGETPFEASKLRLAVHNAFKHLKRITQDNTLIHSATLSGGPIALRDQDTAWPISMESWLVLTSEVSTT